MSKISIKVGIITLLTFGLAAPLAAMGATPTHLEDAAVKVSYADLNIENKAGAKILYARLQRASQEVCGIGSHDLVRSLTESRKARACYDEALTAAVKKIDSAALKEIHSS